MPGKLKFLGMSLRSGTLAAYGFALLFAADASLLRRAAQNSASGAAALPDEILHGMPTCQSAALLQWKADGAASERISSVYSEIAAFPGKSDAQYVAMRSSLATVGLVRDSKGRFYASMRAFGADSETKLLESGAEVDVQRSAAPPPPYGYMTYSGIEAALELDQDDAFGPDGPKPIAFMLQLQPDDEKMERWTGWPRSFGYKLAGHVMLPSQGVWRLIAEVRGAVVTDGHTKHGGFLGNLSSSVAALGRPSECGASGAWPHARLDQAWYQLFGKESWTKLEIADQQARNGAAQLSPPASTATKLPALLSSFPVPTGDNSPAAEVSSGFRDFGPKRHHLQDWGQYFNETRVYSCVTPDLASVQADPRQYQPPPRNPVDHAAAGSCDPIISEHFRWTPTNPAQQDVEWFYNEITVEKSAPYTFFMANGFSGGYFGIQEHPNNKKVAIFSLWDAGSKVEIDSLGEGVTGGRFGLEGTGANSHIHFDWQINQTVQFLVHTKVEPPPTVDGQSTTLYSGFIHDPEEGVWRLLSRLRVRPCGFNQKNGGHLLGMNSFIEVFAPIPAKPNCAEFGVERRARYGQPWFRKKGSSTFEPFEDITLTATCGENCPQEGINYYEVDASSGTQYVLQVGHDVKNSGTLPYEKYRKMPVPTTPPAVLTDAPVPDFDQSPAGKWIAGERRPLAHFGGKARIQRWGTGEDDRMACPWYVVECQDGQGSGHLTQDETLEG